MAEFLLAASAFVLAMAALGLARVLRGPGGRRSHDGGAVARHRRCRRPAALWRGNRHVRCRRRRADPRAAGRVRVHRRSSRPRTRPSSTTTRNHGPPMTLVLDFFTVVGDSRRRVFLPGRHRRPAALSRRADAPARAHQGGQPRPGPGGAWIVADGRRGSGRDQARLRLAARLAVQRDDLATDRARRATRGSAPMT